MKSIARKLEKCSDSGIASTETSIKHLQETKQREHGEKHISKRVRWLNA